jgi:hypothetical protein
MFNRMIVMRSREEAQRALSAFATALKYTKLSPVTQQLLQEQVESTIRQFERQLMISSTHKITADRLFEGDGYRVNVRVRSGSANLFDKLKRFLGSTNERKVEG